MLAVPAEPQQVLYCSVDYELSVRKDNPELLFIVSKHCFLCSCVWKIPSSNAPKQIIQHSGFVAYSWDGNKTWVSNTRQSDLVTHNHLKYSVTIKCLCIAKGRGFLIICYRMNEWMTLLLIRVRLQKVFAFLWTNFSLKNSCSVLSMVLCTYFWKSASVGEHCSALLTLTLVSRSKTDPTGYRACHHLILHIPSTLKG